MILYHGSNVVIKNPISTKGRSDVDFGSGFYLTADKNMARKWASNKNQSIVNVYEVNLSMLKVKQLHADDEWLDYVIYNRTNVGKKPFNDSNYDVIVGPTADDKLFATIDLYSDGIISKEQTIHVVNCMKYSEQIVFKNDLAIRKTLMFIESKELKGLEKQNLQQQVIEERKTASQRANQLIRERR